MVANAKTYTSQSALNSAIWSICDILRRSNCAGALQYVPELTWILFLRILDEREEQEAERAEAVGADFTPSLAAPYRWRDWAAPGGAKRLELQYGAFGGFFGFVNTELLPALRGLRDRPNATPRQKVISEILSGVERVRVDTERNFLDVLDKVDALSLGAVDPTHIFPLSQVYEGLLLKMGEKGNDGGQFFTPREVIRAMVRAVDPRIGETVYDPACGTGGFLAQSFEHMDAAIREHGATPQQLTTLRQRTFFGREKENLIYPIALSNLVLHGIDEPHLWHGNTLTGQEQYGGLFSGAPELFDVVLTNPPFGGKEGAEAQTRFAYRTSATQVLFLQHVINSLKSGGRCGIVLDEGVLFRTNEIAFVQTKRKLLDDCDLWSSPASPPVSSPPPGRASRPTCSSSPRAARPSASGTTTSPTSRSARDPRSPSPTSRSFSACSRSVRRASAAGRSPASRLRPRASTSKPSIPMPAAIRIPARPTSCLI